MTVTNKVNPIFLVLALAGGLFCFPGQGSAWGAVTVGEEAEDFSLEKRGGGTFAYPEEARGKVVFLNFWASWCPECKIELPELVMINNNYQGQPFLFLAVNIDKKRKAADRFLKKASPAIILVL